MRAAGERIWERRGIFSRRGRAPAPAGPPEFHLRVRDDAALEPDPQEEVAAALAARARVRLPAGSIVMGVVTIVVVTVAGMLTGLTTVRNEPRSTLRPTVTMAELEAAGVVYVGEVEAFLVWRPFEPPLALSARSPHIGDRIAYCTTSGWFEEVAHGAMFDRHGYFRLGPAPRGMDRLHVEMIGDRIHVDPAVVEEGPPRGVSSGDQPRGAFCGETNAWMTAPIVAGAG